MWGYILIAVVILIWACGRRAGAPGAGIEALLSAHPFPKVRGPIRLRRETHRGHRGDTPGRRPGRWGPGRGQRRKAAGGREGFDVDGCELCWMPIADAIGAALLAGLCSATGGEECAGDALKGVISKDEIHIIVDKLGEFLGEELAKVLDAPAEELACITDYIVDLLVDVSDPYGFVTGGIVVVLAKCVCKGIFGLCSCSFPCIPGSEAPPTPAELDAHCEANLYRVVTGDVGTDGSNRGCAYGTDYYDCIAAKTGELPYDPTTMRDDVAYTISAPGGPIYAVIPGPDGSNYRYRIEKPADCTVGGANICAAPTLRAVPDLKGYYPAPSGLMSIPWNNPTGLATLRAKLGACSRDHLGDAQKLIHESLNFVYNEKGEPCGKVYRNLTSLLQQAQARHDPGAFTHPTGGVQFPRCGGGKSSCAAIWGPDQEVPYDVNMYPYVRMTITNPKLNGIYAVVVNSDDGRTLNRYHIPNPGACQVPGGRNICAPPLLRAVPDSELAQYPPVTKPVRSDCVTCPAGQVLQADPDRPTTSGLYCVPDAKTTAIATADYTVEPGTADVTAYLAPAPACTMSAGSPTDPPRACLAGAALACMNTPGCVGVGGTARKIPASAPGAGRYLFDLHLLKNSNRTTMEGGGFVAMKGTPQPPSAWAAQLGDAIHAGTGGIA